MTGEHGRFAILALALLIDAAVGDPAWLYRRLPHPVALFGDLISWLDLTLNRDADGVGARRRAGIAAIGVAVGAAATLGLVIHAALGLLPLGRIAEAIFASAFLAQRSLYVHVAAVALALESGGLAAARTAVGHIVGRDPDSLDAAGVSRAGLESLAENYSDGIIAPLFWGLALGLPGLLAYKMINTADSMIGHRSPRHRDFGWAAARLDDAANFLPARLSGLLIVAAAALVPGARWRTAFASMRRDAPRHRSPNAGWPEAALAGALGLALAGPRRYAAGAVDDALMGDGRADCTAADIRRGLRLYIMACALPVLAVSIMAIL